jgi:hypothetical protein
MSDYLRARIDALQNQVSILSGRVEVLEAQLEVKSEQEYIEYKTSKGYTTTNTWENER